MADSVLWLHLWGAKLEQAEIITRSYQMGPSHGDWCVDGQDVTVGVDGSFLVTGVVIENGEFIAEDASWLQLVHKDRYINLAKLNPVLRSIKWCCNGRQVWFPQTDSASVHHWISDTLSKKMRVYTKAASEMLIRHQLTILGELTSEHEMVIYGTLVKCHKNQAKQWWLDEIQKRTESTELACAATSND